MSLIDVGTKAPAFTLTDQNGKHHSLSDYHGRTVVLYFYPKDNTSGCTVEACQFRDHQPDFSKIKAVVLGISPDDESSHRTFADTHRLTFPLLADTGRDEAGNPSACHAYGVWQAKAMYGKSYKGVVRTTYLIDPEGVVRHRWDNVKVVGHVPQVLAAVKELHHALDTGQLVGPLTEIRPDSVPAATEKKRAKTSPVRGEFVPVRGPTGNRRSADAASNARQSVGGKTRGKPVTMKLAPKQMKLRQMRKG